LKNYYPNTIPLFLKTVVTACIFCISFSNVAQPLQFNARKISNETGLYTSDIRHLIKDSKGYIWIATSNKIQRYDGKYTNDFFIKDGNTYYKGIAEDATGKIWVATNTNLYYYKNGYAGFVKYKDTARLMGDYLTMVSGYAVMGYCTSILNQAD
jgi:ligand-binding sensor domain-containing protein